jgi:hypothetical protein
MVSQSSILLYRAHTGNEVQCLGFRYTQIPNAEATVLMIKVQTVRTRNDVKYNMFPLPIAPPNHGQL